MRQVYLDAPMLQLTMASSDEALGQPLWVMLSPAGTVKSAKGDFIMDAESWRLIEAAFRKRGVELPIDYEHHTMGGPFSSPDGTAPAAGWIKELKFDPGQGLFGLVTWTRRAASMIREQEYKYPSPVVFVRPSDKRAVELHSAALTNKPAIERIAALAASNRLCSLEQEKKTMSDTPEETTGADPGMLVAEIKALLGIDVENDTDVIEVLRAIRDWAKSKGSGSSEESGASESESETANSLRTALSLGPDAGTSEIVVAINTLKQAKDAIPKLQAEITALKRAESDRSVTDLLAPYMGKVVHADQQQDYEDVLAMAAENPERCKRQLDQRMAMLPPDGKSNAPPASSSGSNGRATIIASAGREYDENKSAHVASREAWINEALRERGKSPLTEDERKKSAVPQS